MLQIDTRKQLIIEEWDEEDGDEEEGDEEEGDEEARHNFISRFEYIIITMWTLTNNKQ